MNERFKELSKQAVDYASACEAEAWDGAYERKFAELIVRECMTQIQQVREIKSGYAGPEYTQGFDDGMFVAISTIEDHFGVEIG